MNLQGFSLIYPSEISKHEHLSGKHMPDIDMYTLQELGMLDILDLNSSDLSGFFTDDTSVMEYRMSTFLDMMNNPEASETFNKVVPIVQDITELRRLEADSGEGDDYLSSITEIELYISCIDTLKNGLCGIRDKLKSPALCTLADRICELADSEYYSELNRRLSELVSRVREIKSVTVGVNLDRRLRPQSAGVLSVNPEEFKSGDTLDKILRMSFKNDEYTCIADLVPFSKKQSDNQKLALSNAFNSAISDVYKASLRSWKKTVQTYILQNTDFLIELLPEIEFTIKGTELLVRLRDRGLDLCTPSFAPSDSRTLKAEGLYNPAVAVKLSEGEEIVPNDISFDNDDCLIYILTGPNRGGKSVITCAVGLGVAMAQLGMPFPAKSVTLSPVDAIYTHFPTGADDTIDKGRLGEECARLVDIFNGVTSRSLVLLDESLSSTGSYEGSYIASEVVTGLAVAGCRCLFATHLHELAAQIDGLNKASEERGGSRIDTLVAGIEDGTRSFKIYRAKPDGKSYAHDIADKYGLTLSKIIEKLEMPLPPES